MKLLRILAALCLCATAWGQGSRFDSTVFTTASNVPAGASAPVMTVPFAQVTVCAYPAVQSQNQLCSNQVNVYSDPALTQLIKQPFQANAQGRFGFWAAPGPYSYSIIGGGKYLGTYNFSLAGPGGGQATLPSTPGIVYGLSASSARNATVADITGLFSGTSPCALMKDGTCVNVSGGTLTGFTADPSLWPTWLVPTVSAGNAPSLSATASPIPNAALQNSSVTINGTVCALGTANCTPPINMVYPDAGIANSTGSAWGTSYSATNLIPANFLSTFGTAAAGIVSASGGGTVNFLRADGAWAMPPGGGGTNPTVNGIQNWNTSAWAAATSANVISLFGSGSCSGYLKSDGTCNTPTGISGLTAGYLPQATSSSAIGNSFIDYGVTNAGSYTSTKDIYAPTFHATDTSGTGFGSIGAEGTAPSGVSGQDGMWADSTAHRWKMNNNAAGARLIVGQSAAGTAGHIPVYDSSGVDLVDSGAAGVTVSGSSCTITAITNGIITGATCTP